MLIRFCWVVCFFQSIERLCDQSQFQMALQYLPEDQGETYVRIFEAIPEVDRPFVRRVLIWVCGHSRAPWLYSQGINVKLLLSAVAYGFYGSRSNTGACIFDCYYLKGLCSCLITVRTGTGGNNKVTEDPSPASNAHHCQHNETSRLDGSSRTRY